MTDTPACPVCGAALPAQVRHGGRQPVYCSAGCRRAANGVTDAARYRRGQFARRLAGLEAKAARYEQLAAALRAQAVVLREQDRGES